MLLIFINSYLFPGNSGLTMPPLSICAAPLTCGGFPFRKPPWSVVEQAVSLASTTPGMVTRSEPPPPRVVSPPDEPTLDGWRTSGADSGAEGAREAHWFGLEKNIFF